MEAAVAAAFAAIGGVMIAANLQIGVQWASDGPQAGYFPFRIGIGILLCSALVLQRALRGPERSSAPFVASERFRSVLAVAVPTALYGLGIQWLGIYVSSAAFLACFMRVSGRYRWSRALPAGIAFAAIVFWTFERQFGTPLPKGPLEAWLGY